MSSEGQLSYFGLVPSNAIFSVTFTDGGLFQNMHEEMLADLTLVLNALPTLDISISRSGQAVVGIDGSPGQTAVIAASNDLTAWTPLSTKTLSESHLVLIRIPRRT